MKEIFQKAKLPIIIISVVLIGFIAYNTLIKEDESIELVERKPGGNIGPGAEFLPLLSKIEKISFNEKFFTDPVYKTFLDKTQVIIAEEKERPNPFAPVTGGGNSSSVVESLGFEVTSSTTPTQGQGVPLI